jgi:hypothetical protein
MDNEFKKDELQVEQYDAVEVEAKKKRILKKVGIGVGVAALLGLLGIFGLLKLNEAPNIPEEPPSVDYTEYAVPGGNGAWFISSVVFL